MEFCCLSGKLPGDTVLNAFVKLQMRFKFKMKTYFFSKFYTFGYKSL
jgi:hypothetical protein